MIIFSFVICDCSRQFLAGNILDEHSRIESLSVHRSLITRPFYRAADDSASLIRHRNAQCLWRLLKTVLHRKVTGVETLHLRLR